MNENTLGKLESVEQWAMLKKELKNKVLVNIQYNLSLLIY